VKLSLSYCKAIQNAWAVARSNSMVRVELSKIVISDNRSEQVIWLRETEGLRQFSISIGPFEAIAIQNRILDRIPERPLTHDLLLNIVGDMGGIIRRVEVSALKDRIFYAQLVVELNGSNVAIDCRPSDGIALAVRAEAPIFAAEEVMDKAATRPAIKS